MQGHGQKNKQRETTKRQARFMNKAIYAKWKNKHCCGAYFLISFKGKVT